MTVVDVRAAGRFLVRGTRRAVITVVGFALVLLGLAGLVLPILPGWVLIIGGFAVLSREYSWANSALRFTRRKAAQSGAGLRSLAGRWRRRRSGVVLSDDLVIDLTRTSLVEAAEDPVESERTA
ncbi:MAG TPA: PGPGW domain-containing protein [Acidimicrobiia bacterium]|nr:PGPGW domain-containing protein [Acidimicrobiia bacterium]